MPPRRRGEGGPAYRAVADGTIPAIRIGGRILVPTAALLRLLDITDSNGVVADPSTNGDRQGDDKDKP